MKYDTEMTLLRHNLTVFLVAHEYGSNFVALLKRVILSKERICFLWASCAGNQIAENLSGETDIVLTHLNDVNSLACILHGNLCCHSKC